MTRYRLIQGQLCVTKPDGRITYRDVDLFVDEKLKTVGIRFIGESQLRGYAFELVESQIECVKRSGQPVEELPPIP